VNAKKFGNETSRSRRIAGAALKGIGIAGVVGAGLVVKGLKDSIKAAMEQQAVQVQTAAALKSTGRVAGVTAKHIERLATAISMKTGIDDEAIQSSENLLLTFTKIRNEVGKGNNIFDQATIAVQDMSVALKQDAKSSAIQLGKALGDPVRGMTALRRVGVTFTDSQADMIKKLVASGHLLEAQKLILREVKTEFGGSARAAGNTFGGQLKLLGVQIENIQEKIGTALLPMLNRWVRGINNWLSKAENQRKLTRAVTHAVQMLSHGMKVAASAIRTGAAVARRFSAAVGGWKHAAAIVLSGYLALKLLKIAVALRRINAAALVSRRRFLGMTKALVAFYAVHEGVKLLTGQKDMGWDFSDPTAKDVFQKGVPYPKGSPGADAYLAGLRGAAPKTAHTVARDPAYQKGLKAGHHQQPIHVHTTVNLDGKKVAESTTKHQHKQRRRNGAQRTGRHPGANFA
jgi:hypothetical protein